jgi:predicted DNA-binding transcriptional regulator AlpA
MKDQLLSGTAAQPVLDPPAESPAMMGPSVANERLLTCKDVAAYLGITEVGVYLGVAGGRIPPPFYPLSRSPRWRRSEIDAALEATREMPSSARAKRRQARVGRQREELTTTA